MIIKKKVYYITMLVILKYNKNIIYHHIKNRFIKIIFKDMFNQLLQMIIILLMNIMMI